MRQILVCRKASVRASNVPVRILVSYFSRFFPSTQANEMKASKGPELNRKQAAPR